MKAQQSGQTVTITMTAYEATQLEAQLLWASDSDEWLIKAWEALSALRPDKS